MPARAAAGRVAPVDQAGGAAGVHQGFEGAGAGRVRPRRDAVGAPDALGTVINHVVSHKPS
jgi:hypothetical protein